MTFGESLRSEVADFFSGDFDVVKGIVVPDVEDIRLDNFGRELGLAILFIDIRESTRIVDAFRRTTAARMYKAFLHGVAQIARNNDGELRSFNGDGVLVVFGGSAKCNHAVRAAMQMSWFARKVLRPQMRSYFRRNQKLFGIDFDFGIGIDVGTVLVVRGGIRGDNNNDLVWVGNATNSAVKLSAHGKNNYHIYVSRDVYKKLNKKLVFHNALNGLLGVKMWEPRILSGNLTETAYRTNYFIRLN